MRHRARGDPGFGLTSCLMAQPRKTQRRIRTTRGKYKGEYEQLMDGGQYGRDDMDLGQHGRDEMGRRTDNICMYDDQRAVDRCETGKHSKMLSRKQLHVSRKFWSYGEACSGSFKKRAAAFVPSLRQKKKKKKKNKTKTREWKREIAFEIIQLHISVAVDNSACEVSSLSLSLSLSLSILSVVCCIFLIGLSLGF